MLVGLLGALALAGGVTAVPVPAGAAPAAGSSPWPMALHDARHSGTAPVAGPTTGHIAWTRDLGANITPGPVVGANGTIYVATKAGILHAIDSATGADRWTFDAGSPTGGPVDLSVSPLVLPDGDILWPGSAGTLYTLSPSGQVLGSDHLGGPLTSPVLSGNSVYVGTTTGKLLALSVSGPLPVTRWSLTIGSVSYGSPVVAPDGAVVTTVDDCVVVVADHGIHGSVSWTHTFHGAVETSASVGSDGTIVVGTNDPYEYGFTPSGKVAWRFRRGTQSYSSPSVSAALAYFGGNDGALHVVHASDGSLRHTDLGRDGVWGAQAVDEHGDVYFGTQGHHIYGYDAAGHQLFDLTASGAIDSYPALIANGTLIIGDEAGTLYAVGPATS